MPLQPGQFLNNRYRIVRLLGQGGFGAVYRAWDANLSKPCAVKENLDTSPEAQRQFAREATVLANLSHPNLPRVTDHFSLPGQGQYLVMDFVDGEDLASVLQEQGPVSVQQAVMWVSQVADALTYLHNRTPPVVHRDIKPANIRITPDGRVMLVDFGLVKLYDPHMRTTLGARAVTPGYAPPEQYGRGKTDGRTDIYALGATLYNLLTGQDPLESVQRMAGERMPVAHEVNPGIPVAVGQAIECCMRIEPSQRFQKAVEFKTALSAPPATAKAQPGRVDATMVVSPVPEAAVRPVAQAPATHAPAAPAVPVSRRRSSRAVMWGGVAAVLVLCLGFALVVGSWIWDEQQKSAQATSDAQFQATLVERVRLTSKAKLLTTSTARAQATFAAKATSTAEVMATLTAQVAATEQAWADYVANLEANMTSFFGPQDGSLPHDKEDGMIEDYSAGVDLMNFIAEALFFNPHSTTLAPWNYGFIFRHEGENKQYRFVVKSNKTWKLLNNTGDPDGDLISEGDIPDLNVSENGSNHIKIICQGERGLFYLNGIFVAELDLSPRMISGDVKVVTGIFSDDEVTGEATDYQEFTVWSIP